MSKMNSRIPMCMSGNLKFLFITMSSMSFPMLYVSFHIDIYKNKVCMSCAYRASSSN